MSRRVWACCTISLLLFSRSLAAAADKDATINTLTAQETKDGWKLLFDGKTVDGWRAFKKQDAKGWTVKEGLLYLEKPGSGDLITKDKFGNFELTVDWKIESGNNSGILYRVSEEGGTTYVSGPEMQVMNHKEGAKLGKNDAGALYDMYAPTANAMKPADQWNTFKIIANGKHIEQWMNGVKVVDCEIGSEDWNKRIAMSKWKNEKLFASQASGHIALQDHGGKMLFRNIKIKVLDGAGKK
jgi:3-keto-disaccharide hydrolase